MATSRSSLSILFPDFFDLIASIDPTEFASHYPELARLIDRGSVEEHFDCSFEQLLLSAASISTKPTQEIDIVNLTASLDDVKLDQAWIRADPVHLKADGARLRLMTGQSIEPSLDEANELIAELSVLFPEIGLRCGKFPGRWYACPPKVLEFCALSPMQLNRRIVDEHLPQGSDAKYLHSLLNEAQMALHQSPVNQRRETVGKPAINSIWFWRGSQAPPHECGTSAMFWGDDFTAQAMAEKYSLSYLPYSIEERDLGQIIEHSGNGEPKIILVNHPTGPTIARQEEVSLLDFEHQWGASIFRALRWGKIDQLRISDPRRTLVVRPTASWKFWRRSSYFSERLKIDIDQTRIGEDVRSDESRD